MNRFEDNTSDRIAQMAAEVTGRTTAPHVAGTPDPYDMRQVRSHAIAGRDRDHEARWRQVMEHHHFKLFSPRQLDQLFGPQVVIPSQDSEIALAEVLWRQATGVDPRVAAMNDRAGGRILMPHEHPQWRRVNPTAEAFTPDDLITLFRDDPEVFDAWIREHTLRKRARACGIVIPPGVKLV